ncbi:MAG: relaxase/mobilization nuclease domain-containing protein [Opitutaceae bacterium]|jgi:hypothetical protein|nr:relaxase/mobilization nuclease domain-containing protein [Opitutaceae bacterium]
MIVRFFSKGACNLSYCLGIGKKNDPRHPKVIAGDPEITLQIINGLVFDNLFTSLVLSYERIVSEGEALRDIASFESALLPGLADDEWDRTWVRHTEIEKDPVSKKIVPGGLVRSALHCIIPNVHLPTGKRLQPYYFNADKKRIQAWVEITNFECGYASPLDENRQRAFKAGHRVPRDVREIMQALNESVITALANGEITSRNGLCLWMAHQGFEVIRATHKSVVLSHRTLDKNIVMKGKIYEYNGIEDTIEAVKSDCDRVLGNRNADIERHRRELEEGLARKREYLEGRYAEKPKRRVGQFFKDHNGTSGILHTDIALEWSDGDAVSGMFVHGAYESLKNSYPIQTHTSNIS